MGDRSGIAWCDATWNPIIGCTRVSEGCRHCYAETVAQRFQHNSKVPQYHGLADERGWTGQVRLVESALDAPLHWRKPRRIFVNSMGDLFHWRVSPPSICRVFDIMEQCPQHQFVVLTKRPERMMVCQSEQPVLPNVILGTSAEDQRTLDERVPYLLRTPSACRVVSLEPLLGPVDLDCWIEVDDCGQHRYATCSYCHRAWPDMESACMCGSEDDYYATPAIGWVIVGCESGPQRRSCPLEWVRSVVEQCAQSGVPCFVKQLDLGRRVSHNPAEWPEDLRVRQYPEVPRG